jgi:hypothetical protein
MNALRTALVLCLAAPAFARQETAPDPPAAPASAFTNEQLEQIVAPIALYPDALLSQILMAATYPLEIVEAGRWAEQKENAKIKGDALESALQKQTWDPSVKSLCGFREVLARMNDNLDWTRDLGDAFLGQQKELMDAVQIMRRKAYDAGNLKTSKEQTVTEQSDKIIVIETAEPEVIYVPTYYPSAVYGSWSYPYWYYPPLYPPPPAGGAFFGFTAGVIWGAAIWGDCDWGHSDIDIDVDHYNKFVDRTESDARREQVKDRAQSGEGWRHNAEHRQGVGYKDSKVAQKYGGSPGQSRVSRDQARGYGDRAEAVTLPAQRAAVGAGTRETGEQRPSSAGVGTRAAQRTTPSRATGQDSGSFSGSSSPKLDRAGSTRGAKSRNSAGSRQVTRAGGVLGGSRGGGRRR